MATQTKARRKRPGARGRGTKKQAQKPSRITTEDLTRIQYISGPQLSPDGSQVVFVNKTVGEKNNYVSNLWQVAIDGGAPRPFTSGEKDSSPRWSPDGRQVAFVSGRQKGRPQIYLIPAAGGEAVALTKLPEGEIGGFKWAPDGRSLAVTFREEDPEWTEAARQKREAGGLTNPPRVVDDWWYRLDGDGYFMKQRFHLYLVDAATGDHRKIYDQDTLGQFSFDFSPDSLELAIVTNRDRLALTRPWRAEILRLQIKSGRLTPVKGVWDGPKDGISWSPDGKWLAFGGHPGRDGGWDALNVRLFVVRPDGTGLKDLTKGSDYCVAAASLSDMAEGEWSPNIRWTPDSRALYVRIGWHGEGHVARYSRVRGFERFETSGAFEHVPADLSRDGKRLVLTVAAWNRPMEVQVADIGPRGFRLRPLTELNAPLLKTKQLARPVSAWARAKDGSRVQYWVMRPAGFGPRKKTPGILEVHGGPHTQYGVTFFHEFQLLCAQGYTVVFSNPRGSKGYGEAHCNAIRGDWGNTDWLDIQAVMAAMKAHPGIDAKRMGIMGGSYGGYMTNWAVGHTREFKAAITDRCVSNMISMMGSSDIVEEPNQYWPGAFWKDPEKLWAMSPIAHFDKVRTPMLIIHSEGDLRCNIEQSEQVYVALRLKGVPARFVRYPSTTSHGMSRGGPPDMRLHRLGQIVDWWKKYLGR